MKFCNINFNLLNKNQLLQREKELKFIITANAQLIYLANTNERYMTILNKNNVCFDGIIPLRIARLMCKNKNIQKLSGSDIVYDFITLAKEQQLKIFIIGGSQENNKSAVDVIKKKYNVSVDGYSPPIEQYPFSDQFYSECLKQLDVFQPDILFVGLSSPKQEFFIDDIYDQIKHKLQFVIGCGGAIEFLAEKIKRAPIIIQKIGLESVYRLLKEPNKNRLTRIFISFKFLQFIHKKPKFEK